MNGISLKDLRWFSTFNDEFLESKSVSIWQAVLFILPYFDDEASVNYFENIQRMEVRVCEDLVDELDKEREAPRRDDKSPNYANSYTEWDAIANRLLTEEQINAFLPELNRSRMLVIEQIEEADNIYQQLKLEIIKSRDNRPTKILLFKDTLRDDFERVLIDRTSLFAVFPSYMKFNKDVANMKFNKDVANMKFNKDVANMKFNKDVAIGEKKEPVNWNNIKVLIFYQLDLPSISKFTYMEFKVGRKILCKVERENSPFQGRNRTEPNQSFKILEDFRKELHQRKYYFEGKNNRKAITDLRKLLKEITGVEGDPFNKKQGKYQPYEPRFTVEFREFQSRNDDSGYTNKTVSYKDDVTGYTPNYEDEDDMQQ